MVGVTDVGRERSHNEDCIASVPELGLAVLADGMGGYRAGEVASAIAVSMITDAIRSGDPTGESGARAQTGRAVGPEGNAPEPASEQGALLRQAIIQANAAICRTAKTQPQCKGMGTTVVAALFDDDRIILAHVGDSRAYRLRSGQLERLTTDHSLLQELVEKGFYTEEEAEEAGNRNLVTRAIGIEEEVEPDIAEIPVETGDLFLMCSDGLTDLVSDEEIRIVLTGHTDRLEDGARALVELANAHGGKDNVSVILAQARRPFPRTEGSWYSRLVNWFNP